MGSRPCGEGPGSRTPRGGAPGGASGAQTARHPGSCAASDGGSEAVLFTWEEMQPCQHVSCLHFPAPAARQTRPFRGRLDGLTALQPLLSAVPTATPAASCWLRAPPGLVGDSFPKGPSRLSLPLARLRAASAPSSTLPRGPSPPAAAGAPWLPAPGRSPHASATVSSSMSLDSPWQAVFSLPPASAPHVPAGPVHHPRESIP